MDADDDADEVDGGEGVDGVLNGGEVAARRILVDGEGVRGEEPVLGALEHRVVEVSDEIHPLHELLLRVLDLRRLRPPPPIALSVGMRRRRQQKDRDEEEQETASLSAVGHGEFCISKLVCVN